MQKPAVLLSEMVTRLQLFSFYTSEALTRLSLLKVNVSGGQNPQGHLLAGIGGY